MNKINKIIVALGLAMAGNTVQAETVDIDLMSGPFGTGSYVLSTALESINQQGDSSFKVNASETPGLAFNRMNLESSSEIQENTVMSFTAGIDYLASNGIEPFQEKMQPVNLLANYNLGAVWLATFDPDIRNPEDLVGKRIALGRAPQILWSIEPLMIIEHGWEMRDEIQIENLGTQPAAQALLDGHVDAAVVGGYVDPETGDMQLSPQTIELMASNRKLYHISWGPDAVEAVVEQGMNLSSYSIEVGAFEGLEQDIEVFVDPIGWTVHPNFNEQAAYELTRSIIGNLDTFKDRHALGKLMSRQGLVYGWDPENIHPGARRAYQEAGILD